jgi:hypothetical protein
MLFANRRVRCTALPLRAQLDQIPGGDRQAKLFGLWVGCGLFGLGLGGLYFQSLH